MADHTCGPAVGIGYTLATGRLYCTMPQFHAFAESLLERAIFTHEFGDPALWDVLRKEFEHQTKLAST